MKIFILLLILFQLACGEKDVLLNYHKDRQKDPILKKDAEEKAKKGKKGKKNQDDEDEGNKCPKSLEKDVKELAPKLSNLTTKEEIKEGIDLLKEFIEKHKKSDGCITPKGEPFQFKYYEDSIKTLEDQLSKI